MVKTELGGHQDLQLGPQRWYKALKVEETLVVKPVAKYDKRELRMCAVNSNVRDIQHPEARKRIIIVSVASVVRSVIDALYQKSFFSSQL